MRGGGRVAEYKKDLNRLKSKTTRHVRVFLFLGTILDGQSAPGGGDDVDNDDVCDGDGSLCYVRSLKKT